MGARGRAHPSFGMTPTFREYDLWSQKIQILKSRCHTKRRMGAATRAHSSFGMTTTKTLRSVFSWRVSPVLLWHPCWDLYSVNRWGKPHTYLQDYGLLEFMKAKSRGYHEFQKVEEIWQVPALDFLPINVTWRHKTAWEVGHFSVICLIDLSMKTYPFSKLSDLPRPPGKIIFHPYMQNTGLQHANLHAQFVLTWAPILFSPHIIFLLH